MDPTLISPLQPSTTTLGVVELGTNSLKLHLYSRDLDRFEPIRLEWEVGFEMYSEGGRFPSATLEAIVGGVRRLLRAHGLEGRDDLFGIATGAFREAENTDDLLGRLDRELSLPVRVLTGIEEARLLMQGFQATHPQQPTLLFDLGGGRLEMVFLGSCDRFLHETLPLGVIRIQQMASLGTGVLDEPAADRWIREQFREAKRLSSRRIYGTGGTVKALSRVAGAFELTRADLDRIGADVRREGAPAFLSRRRREIFLPGLMVVTHLLHHVGADVVAYHPVGIGEVLMENLRPLYKALGGRLRRAFIDQKLGLFTSPGGSLESPG